MELKQTIKKALDENDLEAVVSLVKRKRSAFSQLIRISQDKETLADGGRSRRSAVSPGSL